jgi:hypothetical protein
LVPLQSSASATAAFCFLASSHGSISNYPLLLWQQQQQQQQHLSATSVAAAYAASIVYSCFMNKSFCACIGVVLKEKEGPVVVVWLGQCGFNSSHCPNTDYLRLC